MDTVPAEIITNIAQYCDVIDVVHMLSCCQSLRCFTRLRPLWQDLCIRDFGTYCESIAGKYTGRLEQYLHGTHCRDTVSMFTYRIYQMVITDAIKNLTWISCTHNCSHTPHTPHISLRCRLHREPRDWSGYGSIMACVPHNYAYVMDQYSDRHNAGLKTLKQEFHSAFAPIYRAIAAARCSRGVLVAIQMLIRIDRKLDSPFATKMIAIHVGAMLLHTRIATVRIVMRKYNIVVTRSDKKYHYRFTGDSALIVQAFKLADIRLW